MTKLNRDDHKVNDIGAAVVKWVVRIFGTAGAIWLGKKMMDRPKDVAEDEEENEENT